MSRWRRLRAAASDLALLCVLALVGAVLVTGMPRWTDHLAVESLRADVERATSGNRDLVLTSFQQPEPGDLNVAREALARYREQLPAPLPAAVAEQWFAATTQPGSTVVPSGPGARLRLRVQSGLADVTTLVTGRWPVAPEPGGPVQIVLSTQIAGMFGVTVGSELPINSFRVRVSGLFEVRDRAAPIWADMPTAVRIPWPQEDQPFDAVAFTDAAGVDVAARVLGRVFSTWRYRFDARALSLEPASSLITAVGRAKAIPFDSTISTSSGLDRLLLDYRRQERAAGALLAVVQLGLIVPLFGATVLAARLAAERRRQEFALLRARGARASTVGLRVLAESAVPVTVAVLAGWLLGAQVPGRAVGGDWAVAAVGAVALLTAPLLAALSVRGTTAVAVRRDLAAGRPSPARLTAELCVVAFALAGVYLLRRRGLSAGAGTDVFLATVPVLLAVGAALIALRLLPVPMGWAAGLAARGRGVVTFLGLNRVARSAGVNGAPLAVLVVAITTGLFTGAVATSIDDARDRATDVQVGADAHLLGTAFGPDTAARVASVPGVDAVAPVAVEFSAGIRPGGRETGRSATVLVVDAPAYQRVLDRGTVRGTLPPTLVVARPGPVVSAVASPALAAELGGVGSTAVVTVRGRPYEVRVDAVTDAFPGLGAQATRFVVLPWQALPAGAPVFANRLMIAGTDPDAAALRRAGDEGQVAYAQAELGRAPDGLDSPSELVTWSGRRSDLDSTGANGVLSFVFAAGLAGSCALALLAVGFAVLTGAVPRGQVLSRLRTMGLAAGAGRRLLVVELVPLLALAAVVGAALGIALPVLLSPALDLAVFTAGVAPRTRVEPVLLGGVLTLVVVALVVAVVVESMINRRLRLGEALRIEQER